MDTKIQILKPADFRDKMNKESYERKLQEVLDRISDYHREVNFLNSRLNEINEKRKHAIAKISKASKYRNLIKQRIKNLETGETSEWIEV